MPFDLIQEQDQFSNVHLLRPHILIEFQGKICWEAECNSGRHLNKTIKPQPEFIDILDILKIRGPVQALLL